MYFNLISPAVGLAREAAYQGADGAYGEHQWLWRFFSAPEGAPRPFLFRRADTVTGPRFYVVSTCPAQSPYPAWQVQSKPYRPRLEVGERFRFDLRANPVVVRRDGEKSKRHDVVMQEKKRLLALKGLVRWQDWQGEDRPPLYELVHEVCGKWLYERSEKLGFGLEMESLATEAYQPQRSGRLQFSTVDFSGVLSVTDPDRFQRSLMQGVGPAKAFGCGLLLIRPE